MDIEIRKAVPADFAAIFDLIKEFSVFIQTPEKVSITPEQMLADQDFFQCLVALEGERIVGFATYFFAYYSWSGKAIYLDDLYVVESCRGQGIGNRLLDAVIETGRKAHCKKVRWQVSRWNEKAIGFYKRRGAAVDEVEINCDLVLA